MFTPPAALQLGPVAVYFYSLFVLAGVTAGYLLAKPAAGRVRLPEAELQLSLFFGLFPGIIGARLYHVIDLWSYYAAHPAMIAAINQGGLGILGGLAGGSLGLWAFARWRRRSFLALLDVWAPSVLLAQAIGRLGNWTNQEAFGPPSSLPWAVPIDPANRPETYAGYETFHPTFFYEAAWDLAGVVLLVALRRRLLARRGAVLGAYLVIYGVGRLLVEKWRLDTAELAGVPTASVICVILVAVGVGLLVNARAAAPRSAKQSPARRR